MRHVFNWYFYDFLVSSQGLLKSKSLGGRMLVESMKKKEDKLQGS